MMKKVAGRAAIAFAVAISFMGLDVAPLGAQQPSIQRKVLLTQDLPMPGYQVVMVSLEIPPGAREGRHTHPGAVAVHVEEGVITFEHEGRPTATYKAGDAFFIEAGKVHEGINNGTSPMKAVATFVVEKGKPLASQAQ
jgi:quercetin dioxygenase-like cupin family protein